MERKSRFRAFPPADLVAFSPDLLSTWPIDEHAVDAKHVFSEANAAVHDIAYTEITRHLPHVNESALVRI